MVITKIMDKNITTISLNLIKILYFYMGLLYIYGKRRLRQIDGRLKHIMRRMDLAEIVDSIRQAGLEKIYFGAWVTLYAIEGDDEQYFRIVGKDELDPTNGWISWISPLAKAMLGKQVGDTILVQSPSGEQAYEVVDVSYVSPAKSNIKV